jgi:hypothetical protein
MTASAVESLYVPAANLTPYSTVVPYLGAAPTFLSGQDAQRILSYQIYEQIYWNVPETFKLVVRGTENSPIYIPSARTIIDTTNRYVAKNMAFWVDPSFGATEEQVLAELSFAQLFKREQFYSKFNARKKLGIIHGDWAWHIVADASKLPGKRISIYAVDPASLFPIPDPDNLDRITGYHLIEQYLGTDGKTYMKRQTYSRGPDWTDPRLDDGLIYSQTVIMNLDEWDDPSKSPVQEISPLGPLPAQITALPVYHIRHQGTEPFGSSELRGFERVVSAINQAMSDEELSLALDGLGMYATDAGAPVDETTGLPTTWKLGPGRVVEIGTGKKFERVTGVSSVKPYLDHTSALYDWLKEAAATPDAAIGKVDVKVAESGISLTLQMGPMLSKVEDSNQIITDVLANMFWDLKSWFLAYEGWNMAGAVVMPTFGDPLPENKSAKVQEILSIVAAGLATVEWGQQELTKYGYDFTNSPAAAVLAEMSARASAGDPFAARLAAEAANAGAESTGG